MSAEPNVPSWRAGSGFGGSPGMTEAEGGTAWCTAIVAGSTWLIPQTKMTSTATTTTSPTASAHGGVSAAISAARVRQAAADEGESRSVPAERVRILPGDDVQSRREIERNPRQRPPPRPAGDRRERRRRDGREYRQRVGAVGKAAHDADAGRGRENRDEEADRAGAA